MPKRDAMRMVEMSPLMKKNDEPEGENEFTLDHMSYDQLARSLQDPPSGIAQPKLPASKTAGVVNGK
jgi:hypothetical protein